MRVSRSALGPPRHPRQRTHPEARLRDCGKEGGGRRGERREKERGNEEEGGKIREQREDEAGKECSVSEGK